MPHVELKGAQNDGELTCQLSIQHRDVQSPIHRSPCRGSASAAGTRLCAQRKRLNLSSTPPGKRGRPTFTTPPPTAMGKTRNRPGPTSVRLPGGKPGLWQKAVPKTH